MSKTILLTGATGGIGAPMARRLLERGHEVIALGRNSDALAELGCRGIAADLAQPESLAQAVGDIDTVDVLIHNAAVAHAGPIEESSVEVWRQHLIVNVAAPAELTRLVLPALRRARGRVVFVNSGAGLSASAMFSAYAASKHGLKALADSLRAEEREHGITVTTVYPSIVDTAMQHQLRTELGGEYDPARAMSPSSVADAIVATIDMPGDTVVNDMRIAPPDPMPHPTSRR